MRDLFLIDPKVTYLNHGSYGACPKSVFLDYQNFQKRLEKQPVQFMTKYFWEDLKITRDTLGDFIKCDGDDILLFPNPTTAINNIIENLDIAEGDEILTTQHEYGALIRAWNRLSIRKSFSFIQQKIDLPLGSKETFIDQFCAGINERTKIIFISHITSQTALIFPVEEICKIAKSKGIITIIDGAHAPGHIDLDITQIGCDYYTGACHKWMCAPKGSSFLYVAKNFQKGMSPQIMSWGEEGDDPGPSQFLMDFQWQGTKDMSAFLAIPSAIRFLQKNKWKEKSVISKNLISHLSGRLKDILGTESLFKNKNWIGQMISHPLPMDSPVNLKDMLWNDFKIEVPIFDWGKRNFIRVSAHFYNDQKDMDHLIKALKEIF